MSDVAPAPRPPASPRPGRARARAAGTLGAVGAVALVGAALPADAAGPVLCPLRLSTGLPCPFCGATRATVALVHGDVAGAAAQNPVWPVALLVVALAAAAVLVAPRVAPRIGGLGRGRRWVAPAVVLLAAGWAWSLTHAATIAPPG